MAGPLEGVRVLDLSAYIAGPYGCSLLADQGADVIKIEPPTGDNLRKYPSTLDAEGRAFIGVTRRWRAIALASIASLFRFSRRSSVLCPQAQRRLPFLSSFTWPR